MLRLRLQLQSKQRSHLRRCRSRSRHLLSRAAPGEVHPESTLSLLPLLFLQLHPLRIPGAVPRMQILLLLPKPIPIWSPRLHRYLQEPGKTYRKVRFQPFSKLCLEYKNNRRLQVLMLCFLNLQISNKNNRLQATRTALICLRRRG